MEGKLITIVIVVVIMLSAIFLMKKFEKKKNEPTPQEAEAATTSQQRSNYRHEHRSGLVKILYAIGVVLILAGLLYSIYNLEIGAGSVISGFIFIALAELVFNSQTQTKILKKLIKEDE